MTANPVFTFVVNVKNEDGSAGEDGLKITIKKTGTGEDKPASNDGFDDQF